MAENMNTPILISIAEETDPEQNNFTWTKKSTKLLLQAYLERKQRFRDPEVKKKQLWHEIAQVLKGHGYTNVDEEILDRKMRNMKRTYKTIKESDRRKHTGRVSWEYYKTFQEIFADSYSSTSSSTKDKNKVLYNVNKKQMDIEERKIETINRIKESLDESNRIQQERNNLIRELLLSQFSEKDYKEK